ncbi:MULTISPECIES: YkvI family membrane protein [Mesobacillus]|uniref:Membrane protein n=2 Tax=Mesobacillus TaxID=2675231 RepID=A0A0D6Z783_9BACI|nr:MULTISPECIES: membrane protein [Mesobacillus]KIY21175.1 membrane protein [Mesobacillus subterraneus]MDQ0413512.1 putative membrane protein YkvI [Mesobacillus stamsii]
MKTNWGAAFQIAAVYVGTVVGAGFATGREIVEFFSRFGIFGLLGVFIAGSILTYMGSKLMRMAASIGAHSYEEMNVHLFGRFFGRIINVLMLFMLLGVCAVMLSGAGAVFEEQLGLTKSLGILVTIALSLGVMIVGLKGVFAVNTFVVPMMILFSLILFSLSVRLPGFFEQIVYIPYAEDGWKAVIGPFSYTALNLSLAQAVLVPVAAEIKDDQTVKWGGIIGGIALTVILLSSHLTLIMLPGFDTFAIPMAVIMKQLAAGLYWIFVLIVYGEIFTSVIGNIYGLERQIQKHLKLPSMLIVSFLFLICYFISLIDYGTLLSFLYPVFGYISLVFMVLLWMKPVHLQKRP